MTLEKRETILQGIEYATEIIQRIIRMARDENLPLEKVQGMVEERLEAIEYAMRRI